jgi:predicted anti-sigma-YlaC factor YlaD
MKCSCEKAEILLDNTLEDTFITLDDEAFLAVHLATCLPCRTYQKEMREIRKMLSLQMVTPALPENMTEQIMQRIGKLPVQGRWVTLPKAIAAVVFAAVIGLSLQAYLGIFPHPAAQQISAADAILSGDTLLSMDPDTSRSTDDNTLSDMAGY